MPMKRDKLSLFFIPPGDRVSLLIFFAGTTVALFAKKYYLFDGFTPIFYAALFGFMLSLAAKSLWKKNLYSTAATHTHLKKYVITALVISGIQLLLLALSLFAVWYTSRLQGLVVINDLAFWPQAILLCFCLGSGYVIYSYVEEQFDKRLFL